MSNQNLPQNESPRPDNFTGEFYDKNYYQSLSIISKKITEKKGTLPNLFYKANFALIPKPDKHSKENHNTALLQTNIPYER